MATTNLRVAISGGGYRAALFAFGSLLYLVDTGVNQRVSSISSVSGGSILNSVVAVNCDFRRPLTRSAFVAAAGHLPRRANRHINVVSYGGEMVGMAVVAAVLLLILLVELLVGDLSASRALLLLSVLLALLYVWRLGITATTKRPRQ